MLNEDKIRIMTRMAMYEKKEGKRDSRTDAWFKGDYISKALLGSFITGTIAFVIIFMIYALDSVEELMLTLYSMDVIALVSRVFLVYIIFMACFEVITWVVYSVRYDKAQKGLHRYYKDVKRLTDEYGGKDNDRI